MSESGARGARAADPRSAPNVRRPRLDTDVMYLKGVGPARAAALHRIGIKTARDLLYHVPHRYEDASTIIPIANLETGMQATVIGRVVSKGVLPTRRGLRIFQVVLRDRTGMIEVSWPGQPYLDRSVERGDALLVSGAVRFFHGRQLQPREFINLGSDDEDTARGRVLAVYPATEGLSFKVIRTLIDTHLDSLVPLLTEYLPSDVLCETGVLPIQDALRQIHRPRSLAEALAGRERLAFEELLLVHLLHVRAKALARSERAGIRFENRRTLTSRLRDTLPFALTHAQVRCIREVVEDMCSPRRMHRLLQGDVGSGKTIVALFAAVVALENGYQAAMMVPTELLAEQHEQSLKGLLEPLGISPLRLASSVATPDRKSIVTRLAAGEPLLVVGTHALLQESTTFARLGLAITDEQHRFGVEQRQLLRSKGLTTADGGEVDSLLMSATPIPRSLALTVYGDLDVSILDERPPGRATIQTALRPETARQRVFAFVNRELQQGRQAYVVYPVIDESERAELKAATTMVETLRTGPFASRRIGLLHGRLAAEERDSVMRAFRDGALDVLVATTVIEVGIDVPNATVMLIEHPERFGLSQLHQLRGRVGRGVEKSYCILLGDVGPDAESRLTVFASTDDGFEIAEADLRLRGMGDLFGERQSGIPMFRVADPVRDEALSARARGVAQRILDADPELGAAPHARLRAVLAERYARGLELFRVG